MSAFELPPVAAPVDASDVAASIRRAAGVSESNAADLPAIAKSLGVVSVHVSNNLPFPGRVTWSSSGPIIQLSAKLSRHKRRFAFAHELAHVALEHGHEAPDREPEDVNVLKAQERLADQIAGQVLLPKKAVTGLLPNGSPTLAEIRSIAFQFDVSMSIVAARLPIGGRPAFLYFLKQTRNGWRALPAVGRTAGLPREMYPDPAAETVLTCLSSRDADVEFEISTESARFRLRATGNRRGPVVLTWVTGVRFVESLRPDKSSRWQ